MKGGRSHNRKRKQIRLLFVHGFASTEETSCLGEEAVASGRCKAAMRKREKKG